MTVGDICQRCGRVVIALVSCRYCGSRICHQCIDTASGFCMICGGAKKI